MILWITRCVGDRYAGIGSTRSICCLLGLALWLAGALAPGAAATVTNTPPRIYSVTPPQNSTLSNALTSVRVIFSKAVIGVNATDLLVNGSPARGWRADSSSNYVFTFPAPSYGVVNITWATNHGITDTSPVPIPFDATAPGATWQYFTVDGVPPTTTSIDPPTGSTVQSLTNITINFSEPVGGVDASDLLLNGQPAQQLSATSASNYTFSFSQPAPGQVQVAWAANHGINDLASPPNAFGGGNWTYLLISNNVRHVIHISLDGAGAYYIGSYISNAPALFPNFIRLQEEGAWTLNARCDYTISVTLPNHACMVTGRPAQQPAGWANTTYHGLTIDSDNGSTIHNPSTGNPYVPYKYSVFDVAHDNGLSTGFLYTKKSLDIFVRSWNGVNGMPNTNGQCKIDYSLSTAGGASYGPTPPIVDEAVNRMATNGLWHYTFMHFDDGDANGHASGWGSAAYSNGLMLADQQIGRILDAINNSPALAGNTYLIVTADHGGDGMGHSDATDPKNYSVPFFLWGPGVPAGVDLYSRFTNRADPGASRPDYTTTPQPIRNGDSGNLALALLGLPSIPGSSMIALLDPGPVALTIARSGPVVTVSWPVSANSYVLQAAKAFVLPSTWQSITNGIITNGNMKVYAVTNAPNAPTDFFRLRKN